MASAASSRPRRRCRAPRRSDDNEMDEHLSEQELLETYLLPHVVSTGGDKPSSFIHEADVYSADPADLTRKFAPAVATKNNGAEAWYFLGPVRGIKGGGGRRKARTVDDGAGCWHSEAGAKPVLSSSSGRRLGRRQSFSFLTKDDAGQRVRSGWLMVEFGLDINNDEEDQVVLSKVYFSPRAPFVKKPAANKRKNLAAASPLPPRRRRHRALSSPEEETQHQQQPPIPETKEYSCSDYDDDEPGSWLVTRAVLGFDTTPIDDERRIKDNPWLKDILRPFPLPPSTPPPRRPSPRRELIEMPEIREFFMRGPYRGDLSDPPLYQFDEAALAADEQRMRLDGDQRGDDDGRVPPALAAQMEFERYLRTGAIRSN